MATKREYSILPQGEKDEFHHHVREGGSVFTSQYICLCTVITVVIFVILTGITALTASMFYSDQISTTYKHFWYTYESISPNETINNASIPNDSPFKEGSGPSLEESKNTASAEQRNSSDYTNNKTLDNFPHRNHIHHDIQLDGDDDNSSATDSYSNSESILHGSMNSGNNTFNHTFGELNSTMTNGTNRGEDIINMDEFKVKFAEAMRDFEKHMENITGIRKAEFVVPIFMLICFLTMFSFISVCCCVIMRRRDNRRRKLFGKLITDLQTGDSKTVLLNHSDLDD